jgi:dTDP-glucose pyrophosphorylase
MINIVIPLAGTGSRYVEAGYSLPKPLIDIKGMPAIQRIVWGAGIGGRLIYVVQTEQNKNHDLTEFLPTFSPELETIVLEVDKPTRGPLESALVAKEYINNEDLLVVYDSEGIIAWDPNKFLDDAGANRNLDVSIAVSTPKNHSGVFTETGEDGLVTKILKESVEAADACAGVYYWRHGQDFVTDAESVINNNEQINGEFHVASVCAKAVEDKKRVGVYQVNDFVSLSDPNGLEERIASVEFTR